MQHKKINRVKRILVITPVPIFPVFGGNRQRIKAVCNALMENGYIIDLFYAGFDRPNDEHQAFINGEMLDHYIPGGKADGNLKLRFREIFNGLLIKSLKFKKRITEGKESARYNQTLFEFKNVAKTDLLKRQLPKYFYQAVLLNYATHSHYFELFGDEVKKVLDTHDRLSNRYKIYVDYGSKPVKWKSLSPFDEKKAIRKADTIWAITDAEKEHFENMTDGSTQKVYTVPHLIKFEPIHYTGKSSKKRILTVSGSGQINIDGLNWFLNDVWPGLLGKVPGAELVVAGSICDKKDKIKEKKNVIFMGRYDKPEEVYTKSRICINPMRYGTGLKIKTLEALSYGKKVVTTTEGAAGLRQFCGKGIFCLDEESGWINELSILLNEPVVDKEYHYLLRKEMDKLYNRTLNRILQSVEPGTDKPL